jgi:hypothetical protein
MRKPISVYASQRRTRYYYRLLVRVRDSRANPLNPWPTLVINERDPCAHLFFSFSAVKIIRLKNGTSQVLSRAHRQGGLP